MTDKIVGRWWRLTKLNNKDLLLLYNRLVDSLVVDSLIVHSLHYGNRTRKQWNDFYII
jgi:hypothetical protein